MAINIPQNAVRSRHWLTFKTGEQHLNKDLHFFSVTGVSLCDIQGDSSKWRGETLNLQIKIPTDQIPIPPKPSEQGVFRANFKSKHWTVYCGLNSVLNLNHAVNSGHAVDTFKLLNPQSISNNLNVECKVAVRDIDAILHRIGFKIDLLLYFDKWRETIID